MIRPCFEKNAMKYIEFCVKGSEINIGMALKDRAFNLFFAFDQKWVEKAIW